MKYLFLFFVLVFILACEKNDSNEESNQIDLDVSNEGAGQIDSNVDPDLDVSSNPKIEYKTIEDLTSGRAETTPLYKIVGDQKELLSLFPEFVENKDPIDFSKNLVIALSMGGGKGDLCYSIRVNSVEVDTKGMLIVFDEISPSDGCVCSSLPSSPLMIVLIKYETLTKYFSGEYQIEYQPSLKKECLK